MSDKKQNIVKRDRSKIDTELALTADLLDVAERLSMRRGWRVTLRALYYVIMRISTQRGRKHLAQLLDDDTVGW